ncbi:putative bifunctional diguanylate cyclase/phosphodiesterase [uncultured Methylobacterium sp.]|uniref:putative bifunctional diguanylate cyclase/phosphodiesterase n=1 Tax=uncultured Methylobacterium sp. TaxID=157278 RepID=UPI0035CBE8C2
MSGTQSECVRLQALEDLKLLDSLPNESFDRVTRMASKLFDLPIAAISLTDRDRQWFKSRVGVEHWQIPRDKAPCAEVAETRDTLVISDMLQDPRYNDCLLARSGIRFYAGAPLITRDGLGLGSMCVLGTEPRQISAGERAALTDLAAIVMTQIELQHAFGRIEVVSGLPNRHQLVEDLQDQARDCPAGPRALVIVETVPFARLQEILRVLGAKALDSLVQTSARILRAALGDDATLYQVGAMQFAWLATGADDAREQAVAALDLRVRSLLTDSGLPILASPVMGVAPFRLGEIAAEDAVRTAFCAAQDARNTDRTVSVYSEAADRDHRRRFGLLSDFRQALEAEDQLALAYQPRVDLATGLCVGAEALLRWTHPALGNVAPGEFIPMVEQTDLVGPVTDWVIAAAIRQCLSWRARGMALRLSVNVCVANLEEPAFAERVLARLAAAGLPCAALEFEVTEGALIRDGTRVGQCLQRLREAGITIAIDDFGTGYSSLSYLQSLPADVIKIDQSFIRNLTGNDRGLTLVRAMIGMAKSLGFHVVAEGIEDETAYAALRAASCDEAQGYLISRPVPPADFAVWFAENRRSGRTRASRAVPA